MKKVLNIFAYSSLVNFVFILIFFFFMLLTAFLNTINEPFGYYFLGDLFFVSCFISLMHTKIKYYSIPVIISIWLDFMWQLPLGLSALIILGQYLFIRLSYSIGDNSSFINRWLSFIASYLVMYIPLKILFFSRLNYVLIEALSTVLIYPLLSVVLWQFFVIFKQVRYEK